MLRLLDANAASTIAEHTQYRELYLRNFTRSPVDRVMPNAFHLPYYKQFGRLPHGYRSTIVIPIVAVDLQYQGPFAIADQIPLERPLPWDRKVT